MNRRRACLLLSSNRVPVFQSGDVSLSSISRSLSRSCPVRGSASVTSLSVRGDRLLNLSLSLCPLLVTVSSLSSRCVAVSHSVFSRARRGLVGSCSRAPPSSTDPSARRPRSSARSGCNIHTGRNIPPRTR